ncbi:MAG: type 4a pilus biogenesis protein PilO [Betaproteobacteria bacterium]
MKALRPLAVFLAVLGAAYALALTAKRDELEKAREALQALKAQYLSKKQQAVNLDLLREQVREADRLFGVLLRDLPNRVDRQFGDVAGAAKKRGVRIEELRPEAQERARDFYAELAAYLRVSGRYHDIGAFVGDLAAAPGSLLLHDLSVDAAAAPGQVTLAATLRAFRYMDEDEIATRRKALRAAKKGKG